MLISLLSNLDQKTDPNANYLEGHRAKAKRRGGREAHRATPNHNIPMIPNGGMHEWNLVDGSSIDPAGPGCP